MRKSGRREASDRRPTAVMRCGSTLTPGPSDGQNLDTSRMAGLKHSRTFRKPNCEESECGSRILQSLMRVTGNFFSKSSK